MASDKDKSKEFISQIGAYNALSSSNQDNILSNLGTAVGYTVGGPIGGAVGGLIGTFAQSVIPTYSTTKSTYQGVNFVHLGLKAYGLSVIAPDAITEKYISDYYCYYGCKTQRTEPLNIPSYMYQNHAFVKGLLQYDSSSSIPLDKFRTIQNIFSNGVHILNG